jgi:tRNA pseudouridine55 synthase
VTIYSFRLTDYTPPVVDFEAKCSSGTYIRSLAHDLGQDLGCGAHLAALRRTEAGKFRASSAFLLEQVEKLTACGNVQEFLIPLESLFKEWPKAVLKSLSKGTVQKGKAIPSDHVLKVFEPERGEAVPPEGEAIFRVFSEEGRFLALARRDKRKGGIVPTIVLR